MQCMFCLRFSQCYYIEPIQREVSRPVSNGLPADKICTRLKKSSSEICSVMFGAYIVSGMSGWADRIRGGCCLPLPDCRASDAQHLPHIRCEFCFVAIVFWLNVFTFKHAIGVSIAQFSVRVLLAAAPEAPIQEDTDLTKLTLKQLRQLLAQRGVTCDGCIEKSDFVRRAQETKGKKKEL